MAEFKYTAKNIAGETVTGVINADNKSAAITQLEEKKLFLLKIQDQSDDLKKLSSRRKVKAKDIGIMYGQLADLLSALITPVTVSPAMFFDVYLNSAIEIIKNGS